MNIMVVKDYMDDIRKGSVIQDALVLPYHYSGILIRDGAPRFVRVPKQYCQTIKPIKNGKRKPSTKPKLKSKR